MEFWLHDWRNDKGKAHVSWSFDSESDRKGDSVDRSSNSWRSQVSQDRFWQVNGGHPDKNKASEQERLVHKLSIGWS